MRAALFTVIAVGLFALAGAVSLIIYNDYYTRTNSEPVTCDVRGYAQKEGDSFLLVECGDFFGHGDPTRQIWKDASIGDRYTCTRTRTYFDTLANRSAGVDGCVRVK